MHIAVLNKSSVVADHEASLIARACARQMKLDLAPRWDIVPPSIVFYRDLADVPPGALIGAILDDSDDADALAYHDETPDGRPYASIFAKTIVDNGGTVLQPGMSVAGAASHEFCEMAGDVNINLWADSLSTGWSIARELSDPCEDVEYAQRVWDGHPYVDVAVSDFVTPAYFDEQAPHGSQFDFCNKITRPWGMTKGGYLIVRKIGAESEKTADKVVDVKTEKDWPQWETDLKLRPTARTLRRITLPE